MMLWFAKLDNLLGCLAIDQLQIAAQALSVTLTTRQSSARRS